MKLIVVVALAFASVALAQLPYPPAKTVDATDIYFGTTYKDPYRWLENDKDPAVGAWFKSQAALTDSLLAKIPARDALADEWTRLDKLKPARYSEFDYAHGRLFYKKTLGVENVGKLYVRDGWDGAERLLFDPAKFRPKVAKPGDVTTLETALPSPDGRFVAVGFSAAGAEFSEIRVLDVDRGALLPDSMYPSYGPLGWTMDSQAIFYDMGTVTDIKSQDIELNRQTRLHKIGTPVSADTDFFSNRSYPALGITAREFPQASIDESYPDYVIGSLATVQNEMRIFYAPTAQMKTGPKVTWRVLCNTTDHLVRGLEFDKDFVYAVTYTGAPKYKLVRTSVTHPDWQRAETVIPEANDSIQYISKSESYLFVAYSDGILSRIVKYNLQTGKTAQLELPASGTAGIFCPDVHSNRCIVVTTSWTQPETLWDFDGDKDLFAKSAFNTPVTYPGFESLVSDEVEARSYDGTMVPLSIIHRKDLTLDGSTPAILDGYGSYGLSHPPAFDVRSSVALHGVVLGYCHVRGGGEKGEDWYKAGYKATKPNTWKDFIACAEYLTKKGYTSPARLAGSGTSAGGILISRAITERPDLFAAAVCNVCVANALRGEFSANGPVNVPEFGTVKDPVEVKALAEMDGLLHVQPGVTYPAVLGVAGWNDPRVAPWLPGKFVAALQAASTSGKPVLLKVNYDDGHFTEEKTVTFRNFAGQYAFLLWQTGHREFQPATSSAIARSESRAEPLGWDAKAAASYLDSRAEWWTTWPSAKRDHGTFCMSCHTTLPYALARPALRRVLAEPEPAPTEAKILSNLLVRARTWRDIEPFYPDQTRGVPKTSESRAIESVMNALVLARRDAELGHLSDDGKTALANMWALQMRTGPQSGAWTWLNFGYEPWESPNSPYFGASMAALAVGSAPDRYASAPEIKDSLDQLRGYFQKQFEHESLHNRLVALWASSRVPDLLTAEQRRATIDQAFALQQSDGGWSSSSLGPFTHVDNTPNDTGTDGYATALNVLALQSGGIGATDPRLAKGLEWLRRNQDRATGRWAATSLNKRRDPESDPGKFMSDAATAYAVLALTARPQDRRLAAVR